MLKISVKARIEDFDAFFKRNFTDYRIALFEKQKFRLRKLVNDVQSDDRVPGELDIRFAIDDSANAAKHNALRQERPKTPTKIVNVKSVRKVTPVKEEQLKSLIKPQNTLVRVKMTKEEYDEYMKQAQAKQQAPQFKPQIPQPISSKNKPPVPVKSRSPIRSKRV